MVKRLYFKLERLGAKRPIILALIVAFLPNIFNIVIPKEINNFMVYHKLNIYLVFGILTFQIFTFFIAIFYFNGKGLRKQLLKKK